MTNVSMIRTWIGTALICGSLASLLGLAVKPTAAIGQESPPPLPRSVEAIIDCRQIADQTARLGCYEAASVGLERAIANRDIIFTDPETVRETRRRLFGFSLPKLSLFAGDEGDEDLPDEISNTVASAWVAGDRMRLRFADDSVWQQIGPDRPRRLPAKGTAAVIKRASMGTYFVRLGGQIGIRMIRVE